MSNARVQLRAAAAADIDAVLALERATEFAPHWARAAYVAIVDAASVDGPKRCLFVAERDGSLVGFAVGLMHPAVGEGRVAELESVVVAADARRAGIGRELCDAAVNWCRYQGATEIVLEVRAASIGVIALYAGLRFTQSGRRPRYYSEPEDDAVMMGLRLA